MRTNSCSCVRPFYCSLSERCKNINYRPYFFLRIDYGIKFLDLLRSGERKNGMCKNEVCGQSSPAQNRTGIKSLGNFYSIR